MKTYFPTTVKAFSQYEITLMTHGEWEECASVQISQSNRRKYRLLAVTAVAAADIFLHRLFLRPRFRRFLRLFLRPSRLAHVKYLLMFTLTIGSMTR
jgi:hypothetical protein